MLRSRVGDCRSDDSVFSTVVRFALTVQIALFVAAFDRLTFVVFALATGQRQQNFYFAAFEIKLEGNQGLAFFIDLAVQLLDLSSVQQQLAGPHRIMIVIICKRVGADVHLIDENFTIFDPGIGVLEIGPALPQRFDLRAHQNEAGFNGFIDEIIEARLAVLGNDFDGGFIQFGSLFGIDSLGHQIAIRLSQKFVDAFSRRFLERLVNEGAGIGQVQ